MLKNRLQKTVSRAKLKRHLEKCLGTKRLRLHLVQNHGRRKCWIAYIYRTLIVVQKGDPRLAFQRLVAKQTHVSALQHIKLQKQEEPSQYLNVC